MKIWEGKEIYFNSMEMQSSVCVRVTSLPYYYITDFSNIGRPNEKFMADHDRDHAKNWFKKDHIFIVG